MIAGILAFAVGNWQRLALYAALAVILLGTAAGWGYHRGVLQLYDYQVKQATAAVKVITRQGAVTTKIVTRYIRAKARAEQTQQTTHEEVVRYEKSNPGLCLDARWRLLHDSAASGTLPPAPSGADGASDPPKAAAAIDTVTSNYGAHNDCADKLDALQAWVREQAAIRP